MADTRPMTLWGVHMRAQHQLRPIERGFIAIGWSKMGDLAAINSDRESFKQHFASVHPDETPGAVPVKAGVLFRFANEIAKGDLVIFPSKPDRMVNIGIIKSNYIYDSIHAYVATSSGDIHVREVNWKLHLPRTEFSQSALQEIGAAITLFQVTNNAEEFIAAFEGKPLEPTDVDETNAEAVSDQVEENTEDFILKRLKGAMDHYQFEHFIAHLLKCMGYHARVTQASKDGGVDIIAHKDELGFEPPIIKVQCKQIQSTIGRPDVQQLHGAIEHGEHGLFVSLGNFSPDALSFERTKPNLRLIDGTTLTSLIYRHYDEFEPQYQTLLPLKRRYIPGPVQRVS